MTVPTLLDWTRPYSKQVGKGINYVYFQDGYGFDNAGYFCYDPATDPNAPKPNSEEGFRTNLPKRYQNKVLDRSKPFGKLLGEGRLPYVYLQNHMGFDADGNAVWGEPGHWGVPLESEAPAAQEPEPVVETDDAQDPVPVAAKERVYPLDYLQSLKATELKALFFREFPEDGWKGEPGRSAKMRAIRMLGELEIENDVSGAGADATE